MTLSPFTRQRAPLSSDLPSHGVQSSMTFDLDLTFGSSQIPTSVKSVYCNAVESRLVSSDFRGKHDGGGSLHYLRCYMISMGIINGDNAYMFDNSRNTRIVSDDNDCSGGRIQIWDGTKWGTFSDCAQTMTNVLISRIRIAFLVQLWSGFRQ